MHEMSLSSMSQVERTAYAWVQREHAGLTAEQERELEAWLADDMTHFETFDAFKANWERFEEFSNDVVLEEPAPDLKRFAPGAIPSSGVRFRVAQYIPYLAAAAAIVLAFVLWQRPGSDDRSNDESLVAAAPIAFPSLLEQITLDDGSTVELNRDSRIEVAFSAAERRVRLLQGEANFTVSKDAARPFIVNAAGVEVRAVGTAFNVRLDSNEVEVVVSEGKVQVATPQETVPLLAAGQVTRLSLTTSQPPTIEALTPEQLESKLLWQPKLLDFDNAALAEIVAEFNRRNPVTLVIGDDSLRARRMSATFRSDNIEGFVRLLEAHFAVRAERNGEGEIALLRK